MKPALRSALLAAALGAAAWLAFFGRSPTTDSGVVEPTRPRADASASAGAGARNASEPVEILELRPRAASSTKTNALFGSTAWVAAPKAAPTPPPPAPQAPQAPQLPFSYLGKRFDGVRWEVFVDRGSDTLILRENDLIDGTYRIDSIRPPQLSVVYLPLNQKQTLAIGPAE